MSYAAKIRNAAGQAQAVLAQTGGAEPGQKNALYNGAEYLCVYGAPSVEREMLPNGGYRQRSVIMVAVTRAQFSAAPQVNTKWVRIDMTPQAPHTIVKVGTDDPYIYMLTLVKLGQ